MINKENVRNLIQATYDILVSYVPENQKEEAKKELDTVLSFIDNTPVIKDTELQFMTLSTAIGFQVGLISIIHPEIAKAVTQQSQKFSTKGE